MDTQQGQAITGYSYHVEPHYFLPTVIQEQCEKCGGEHETATNQCYTCSLDRDAHNEEIPPELVQQSAEDRGETRRLL